MRLRLPLLLFRMKRIVASRLADPEGAGHGWPAFSDRARMASRKIPERINRRVSFVGETFFFGSVSFGVYQKK
ncbi:hypothetical protein CMZ84_13370 [Lysobacteraceae bacterium NML93-0399]|nr:hypothetical protein CMZ84_13370 [Xanthomonadaceae bacterium NML93-0399]